MPSNFMGRQPYTSMLTKSSARASQDSCSNLLIAFQRFLYWYDCNLPDSLATSLSRQIEIEQPGLQAAAMPSQTRCAYWRRRRCFYLRRAEVSSPETPLVRRKPFRYSLPVVHCLVTCTAPRPVSCLRPCPRTFYAQKENPRCLRLDQWRSEDA